LQRPTVGGKIIFHVKEVDNNTFGTVTVNVQCGSATGTIVVYMRKPVIELTKISSVTSAGVGSTVTYTISCKNSGNSNSVSTVIKEKIPTNVTYTANTTKIDGVGPKTDVADADEIEFSGGILTINLGTVGAGVTKNVTFDVTVD